MSKPFISPTPPTDPYDQGYLQGLSLQDFKPYPLSDNEEDMVSNQAYCSGFLAGSIHAQQLSHEFFYWELRKLHRLKSLTLTP